MEKPDADWAFAQYERVRDVLPSAHFAHTSEKISHMLDVAERFDVFLLDAFGVLNIGNRTIPGAPEWVRALKAMGKRIIVVANGASLTPERSLEKYARLGFDFSFRDVVASRGLLAGHLSGRDEPLWGAMVAAGGLGDDLPVEAIVLGDRQADYDRVDGFVFLGSGEWTPARQDMLRASLLRRPRPVLAGNPDIVAPRETGFTLEPGWYAHELARQCDVTPLFFGKPFAAIYDEALARIDPLVSRDRIVMVGDTLHTDILGGRAAGVRTILMADYGLFAGRDVAPYIAASGIVPDYILSAGT
ncbi:MAG TPA: TIGR01459 family HAD-type hydrolase [Devosia sp.]|nr:TIGR01459 family HAD-type hydrolase [Devosia sp.]